jgi:hypothetical protein
MFIMKPQRRRMGRGGLQIERYRRKESQQDEIHEGERKVLSSSSITTKSNILFAKFCFFGLLSCCMCMRDF